MDPKLKAIGGGTYEFLNDNMDGVGDCLKEATGKAVKEWLDAHRDEILDVIARKATTASVALVMLVALLGLGTAEAQISCFSYAGGVVSCDSPSHNTTITPLGRTGGVITEYGSGRNTLEPYTIITPEPRSRRAHDLDLEPLAPLPSLEDEPDLPGLQLPGLPGLELP